MAFLKRVRKFVSAMEGRVDEHFLRSRQLRNEKEKLGNLHISVTHRDPVIIPEASKASLPGSDDQLLYHEFSKGKLVPVHTYDLYRKSGSVIPYNSVMHDPSTLSPEQLDAVLSNELVKKHAYPPRLVALQRLRLEMTKRAADSKKNRK